VAALAQEMLVLLQTSLTSVVDLRLEIAAGLPLVELDATQFRQVLMNLVINASEAISGTGSILVSIATCSFDSATIRAELLQDDLAPGEYLMLRVADTGVGMDEATRKRIFDPFFTTKFTGRGLGLAAVLGIVRGHHGAVQVASRPGFGTTFTVYFPVQQPLDDGKLRSAGLAPTEQDLLQPRS
jgi:signal transduction histidine kinase